MKPGDPRSPEDLAAVEVLREADGRCRVCELQSPALIAVEVDGKLVAECLNPEECRQRARRSLRDA